MSAAGYKQDNRNARGRSLNSCGSAAPGEPPAVVSLSGGKDSTALLILMVERGMPIHAVIHAETGMDFPEMAEHIDRVDGYLFRERGMHITRLRHPNKGFEWLMFEQPKVRPSAIQRRLELGMPLYGNGWPGIRVRWCTGQLKTHLIAREVKRLGGGAKARQYIGIAADEAWRVKNGIYPLVEWGISEAEALQVCYGRGFDFGGLYKIYRRASCWCCPFQRITELRNLRRSHPQLWARLLEMDGRAREQFGASALGRFRDRWSVSGLDERFRLEEKAVDGKG